MVLTRESGTGSEALPFSFDDGFEQDTSYDAGSESEWEGGARTEQDTDLWYRTASAGDVERQWSRELSKERLQTATLTEVGRHFRQLPERHQLVLKLRFGLGGADEHTLEQIGQKLGLTRQRVRELEKAALDRLRSLA